MPHLLLILLHLIAQIFTTPQNYEHLTYFSLAESFRTFYLFGPMSLIPMVGYLFMNDFTSLRWLMCLNLGIYSLYRQTSNLKVSLLPISCLLGTLTYTYLLIEHGDYPYWWINAPLSLFFGWATLLFFIAFNHAFPSLRFRFALCCIGFLKCLAFGMVLVYDNFLYAGVIEWGLSILNISKFIEMVMTASAPSKINCLFGAAIKTLIIQAYERFFDV